MVRVPAISSGWTDPFVRRKPKKKRKPRHSLPSAGAALVEDLELRRLMSARAVSDCVEQFRVFGQKCTSVDALYDAFSSYRDIILNSLKLRRANSGENVEADILLINAKWMLEESSATNNSYRLYIPEMRLRPREPKTSPLQFDAPQPKDGVAIYAVYASTQGRSGVAIAKDVSRKQSTTSFWEAVAGTKYKSSNVGDMYMPPPGEPGKLPPYRTILSVPITVTQDAAADPLTRATTECIGVLNITHSIPVGFNAEDCAWAQTCASMIGSFHGSFFLAMRKLEDISKYGHPNEVLLRRTRERRRVEKPELPAASGPIKILVIAGDRGGAQRSQIQMPKEFDAIKSAVESKDAFELVNPILAATHAKIGAAYQSGAALLHFAGHGDDRSLSVILDHGAVVSTAPVDATQLAEILKNFPTRIRLCVLNTCESAGIAKAIVESGVVDAAVGWPAKVQDEAAITFSDLLYRGIGDGLALSRAVSLAGASCRVPAGEAPILHVSSGVNRDAPLAGVEAKK